jgi:hypothetical protein
VVKAQEIKSSTTEFQVHYSGLGLFRLQAEVGQQTGQTRKRPFGLVAGPAHDGRVVGVPDQDPIRLVPCPIQSVQVNVAEDG